MTSEVLRQVDGRADGPAAPQGNALTGHDPGQVHTRLTLMRRRLPLPLLAASALLAGMTVNAVGTGADRTRFLHVTVPVSVLAAAWVLFLTSTLQRRGAAARVLGVACHLALTAVLVGLHPWFGLYAWTGYLTLNLLPERAREPAMVPVALIAAASQLGGFGIATRFWPAYLFIAAVNFGLALVMHRATVYTTQQNERLHVANGLLEAALAENAGLHAQLVAQAREAGVQDERQRMAGEIHDTLAQGLAGIITQLEAAEQACHEPTVWQRHVRQARALARTSLAEARRSVRALRPEQLDGTGLAEALDELARTWSGGTAVRVRTEVSGIPRPLGTEAEAALFRVAQEGLANVAKHARARTVHVTLTFLDDVALLDIRDDGTGFAVEPGELAPPAPAIPTAPGRRAGFGLEAMRQRLARVGGVLEVESAVGQGTALSARVPARTG